MVLGYDVHGKPWLWPDRIRVLQGLVLGLTGMGKTTLLKNIITQDLMRVTDTPAGPRRMPIIILDGKGEHEFFEELLPYIHRAGRRVEGGACDSSHSVRAAYFNTTGVMVNGKIVRHRKIAGHLRFNGAGGFSSNYPSRMIGKVFECDEPCVWNGQNKVFFHHIVRTTFEPDCFLVVVKSEEFGRLHVGTPGWKSEASFLISFSEWRDQQEALLLMPYGNWVRTSLGKVVLVRDKHVPWRARLRFEVTD